MSSNFDEVEFGPSRSEYCCKAHQENRHTRAEFDSEFLLRLFCSVRLIYLLSNSISDLGKLPNHLKSRIHPSVNLKILDYQVLIKFMRSNLVLFFDQDNLDQERTTLIFVFPILILFLREPAHQVVLKVTRPLSPKCSLMKKYRKNQNLPYPCN